MHLECDTKVQHFKETLSDFVRHQKKYFSFFVIPSNVEGSLRSLHALRLVEMTKRMKVEMTQRAMTKSGLGMTYDTSLLPARSDK